MLDQTAFKRTRDFIFSIMPLLKQPARGIFRYPFLTVSHGQHYATHIFSWDNHHMSLAFAMAGEVEQMKYYLANMLNQQDSRGFVPCTQHYLDGGSGIDPYFHAQPFLAQNAAIYLHESGDLDMIREIYPKLAKYLAYWFANYNSPIGLCRWNDPYMSGVDNEINGMIYPPDTILSPDLNSLLYLELNAMAFLAGHLEQAAEKTSYLDHAEKLKAAINQYCWSESAGTYGAYNLAKGKVNISWGDGTLTSDVGAFAFISCSSLFVLYAGCAPQDRAKRMIETYVLAPEHFRSPWGIRSLSKSSEYYNNGRWGMPTRFGDPKRETNSNWQGPVWILLNHLVFHALLRYGYHDAAESLANDTAKVINHSLDLYGYMRENFDGDTGEPLYADYFGSWNLLAAWMPDYLSGKKTISLFPWQS